MISYKPNLEVTSLTVLRRGHAVFDEKFHTGLNIIRGENSSGKSTIMDFIFFGLGGDLLENQWREAALLCDVVVLGVKLNGKELTLRREVERKSSQPMKIFFGPVEEATKSAEQGWERYSFRRGKSESFSQVIFRLLGLPEVQYGETNTKITMNQVLRLLYSDQLSSVEKIFRSQPFDDAITRQTVGDLLLGAYSQEYYSARLRLKALEAEIKDASDRISTLTRVHGRDGHPLTLDWVNQEQNRLEDDLNKLNLQIEEIEARIFSAQFEDRLSLNDQKETFARLQTLQAEIAEITSELQAVELDAADSDEFIDALTKKLEALHESKLIVDELNALAFDFCPACFAPVSKVEVEGACSLCKQATDHEKTKERALRLINEYARQRQSSLDLQASRHQKVTDLRAKLAAKTELWEQAGRHYTISVRSPTTELRTELRKLNREAGYSQRKLEELATRKAAIAELREAQERRDDLQRQIDDAKAIIAVSERRNREQISNARRTVENEVLDFLRRDLERQSTFTNAQTVGFEFDGDRLNVNGESFFSASSMVYLRNSFIASLAVAAANSKSFSHPRFMLMDTVEDKGMEPDRSKNFQRILHEKSTNAASSNQIIIATSMIADELNKPGITVGDFYTHENRTLNLNVR
ncbi:AAA family ATPase [Leisingera sp. M527]|uniref:AAA family ATPase n=1 Tax=Leisingera sp. M527 TaxID=2867014 RepID=UPI0021A2C961|nr:AAA family ATPase [Leisingera sp. M527]UWQ32458.1 AAA family ATPase [Leisingera sp. M527]